MKISLVMAPNWSRVKPPISLALFAANLKKYNHEVSVFDLNNQLFLKCKEEYQAKWGMEEDIHWIDKNFINEFLSDNKDLIDDYVEDILERGSKVIGFSVYFPNQLMSLEIAKLIKERDRDRIIVFGGPQCMRKVAGRDIIKQSCVDAIVVNEGDQTVAEMARVIEENGNLEFCQGT